MTAGLVLALFAWTADGSKDAPPLGLTDLPAYRAALDGKPPGTALPATFRELWDRPEAFRGRRVSVEGRVVRRFRQPALGTFPPLVEAWAVTPTGDPLCLVYPDLPAPNEPNSRATVRFEGVFLRTIRYQGGDSDRLAPLVVGDKAPTVTRADPKRVELPRSTSDRTWGGFSATEWALGAAAAGVVVLVLAVQHLKAPVRPPPRDEPPPEFVEAE